VAPAVSGAAVSRALAQEGASVAAGYWHSQEAAEKFAASMQADYPRQKFTAHEGNIGVADDCRRVVKRPGRCRRRRTG
jgi:hypothetical protein